MPRENTVEKSRVHFSWQAQYLVKLECDFSWQVQHVVTFWEIAGARNVVFFNLQDGRGKVSEAAVRDDDFMFRLSSDYLRICLECLRIVFLSAEALH